MIFIVLGVIAVIVIVILCVIFYKRGKDEVAEYYAAAGNILREEMLSEKLKKSSELPNNTYGKLMIYMKSKTNKDVKFVFDPSKTIPIGRDRNSKICVNEATVSSEHCVIYSDKNGVYISDCNSKNGSTIKRGGRRYHIGNGNVAALRDGDELTVGSSVFKITIFVYDYVTM